LALYPAPTALPLALMRDPAGIIAKKSPLYSGAAVVELNLMRESVIATSFGLAPTPSCTRRATVAFSYCATMMIMKAFLAVEAKSCVQLPQAEFPQVTLVSDVLTGTKPAVSIESAESHGKPRSFGNRGVEISPARPL
jgi:hypothetical protein